MAQKQSQAVATAQALTGSYVVANVKSSFSIDGESVGALFVSYTTGAAETSNTLSFKIEFSYDGTNWFQQSYDTLSSGVNTLADLEHAISGASAATTYTKGYVVPLSAKYMRVYFKETGVAANFGTVSANIVLGAEGQSYNHQSIQSIAGGEGTVGSTTTRVVYALQPKIFTESTASVTGSSSTVLASNANRKVGTSISNAAGTGVLYLNTTDAAVVGQGWAVQPGQTFTMSENEFTTAAITGISSSGTITASVMEAT